MRTITQVAEVVPTKNTSRRAVVEVVLAEIPATTRVAAAYLLLALMPDIGSKVDTDM